MQNFGRENFDDSTCIRQNSSDFSTIKVLCYTVAIDLQFLIDKWPAHWSTVTVHSVVLSAS